MEIIIMVLTTYFGIKSLIERALKRNSSSYEFSSGNFIEEN